MGTSIFVWLKNLVVSSILLAWMDTQVFCVYYTLFSLLVAVFLSSPFLIYPFLRMRVTQEKNLDMPLWSFEFTHAFMVTKELYAYLTFQIIRRATLR